MADNAAEPRPDPPLTTVDPRLISTKPKLSDARLEQIHHSLTLEFRRVLSESEWREVVEAARQLPYVQGLQAEETDLAELTRLRAERDEQAKHAQDAWRQLNGECPICVEKGILPSRPYGCYGHSQVVIENLETAEAERDEAQHRLDLFKNQLSVQEERTDSWHEAYDALHAQLEELKDCVCDWINEGLIVPDGRLSSMLASAPSAVPEPTG